MIPDKRVEGTTETIILEILAKKPQLSVQKLYSLYAQQSKKPMTLQGFYRVIRKLLSRRVLVKEGGRMVVDAGWILAARTFVEQLEQTYLQPVVTTNILLEDGLSQSFSFNSLREMDNFWNHALFVVVRDLVERGVSFSEHTYTDHYWPQITTSLQEEQVLSLYRERGVVAYHVVAEQTFLGTLLYDTYASEHYKLRFGEIAPYGRNTYIVVIGEYIFETSVPKYLFELIDAFFHTVNSLANYNASELLKLIDEPGKVQLKISHDSKRAKEIRQEIEKKCGV